MTTLIEINLTLFMSHSVLPCTEACGKRGEQSGNEPWKRRARRWGTSFAYICASVMVQQRSSFEHALAASACGCCRACCKSNNDEENRTALRSFRGCACWLQSPEAKAPKLCLLNDECCFGVGDIGYRECRQIDSWR
uniref:Putative secreted protein n=1 Tax=Anopheles triannulatus TaxID=58253 RepID=A0A2M4B6F8_9DIPT